MTPSDRMDLTSWQSSLQFRSFVLRQSRRKQRGRVEEVGLSGPCTCENRPRPRFQVPGGRGLAGNVSTDKLPSSEQRNSCFHQPLILPQGKKQAHSR